VPSANVGVFVLLPQSMYEYSSMLHNVACTALLDNINY
jgi:hypothetical protein